MDGCLKLSSVAKYALSAAIALVEKSKNGKEAYFPLKELAKQQSIPAPFLAKVVQPLVKKGIFASKKGVSGGLALNRPPEQISLLELIETCEGAYSRGLCIFFMKRHCPGSECPIYCPLRKIEEGVKDQLRLINLADLTSVLSPAKSLGIN